MFSRNVPSALAAAAAALSLTVLAGCKVASSQAGQAADHSRVEHGAVSISIEPSGKRVLFSSAAGRLYWFDLSTKTVSPLEAVPSQGALPAFSPDGKTLAYAAPAEGKGASIRLFDLATGESHRLTSDAEVSDGAPCFSPDGKEVAFARAYRYRPYSMGGMVWDDYDVCVVGVDGKGLRRLTHGSFYGLDAVAFAGDEILFSASGRGVDLDSSVYAVDLDGKTTPRQPMPRPADVGNIGAWAGGLAVSPDGTRIAFVSDRATPFEYDIYVAGTDGSNPVGLQATAVSRYNQRPVFKPDGEHLLFLAGTEWNASSRPIFSLWEIDLEGHAVQVADSGLFTNPDAWKPKR